MYTKNKKTIVTSAIQLIVYFVIFASAKSYINENELLKETISKYFVIILISWIIVKEIFIHKYDDLPKSFNFYISVILIFFMSLYGFNFRYNAISYLIYIIFIVIYALLVKYFKENLKKIDKKVGIFGLFIIYLIFHIFTLICEMEIFDFIPFIIFVNKFYIYFDKEGIFKKENYEIMVTFIIATIIFDFYYSFLLYLSIFRKKDILSKML